MKEWLKARSFEDVGRFYDDHYLKDGAESFKEDRTQVIELLRRFRLPAGSDFSFEHRMLDAGCGNGQMIEQLCDKMECVGIEVSRAAYLIARNKLGSRAVIKQMPIEEIEGHWEGMFDFITCLGVLEHTMDPKACHGILMRCLRPGGLLIATVPIEFDDCFMYIRAEANQRTNERFATIDEWLDYFGRGEEAFVVVGEGETKHVAIIFRKEEQ